MSEQTLTLPDGRTVKVRLVEPEAYQPNPTNTNRGQERGKAALDKSLAQSGFHRGIVVAKDGTVVNGNHAYESASEQEVVKAWIEVEVEGDVGVATKRIDWDGADDPAAILAAIADNRVSELNFALDPEMFAASLEKLEVAEIDLPKEFYTPAEIDFQLNPVDEEEEEEPEDVLDADRYPLAIVLDWSTHKRWQELKEAMGISSDTKAFLKLMDSKL